MRDLPCVTFTADDRACVDDFMQRSRQARAQRPTGQMYIRAGTRQADDDERIGKFGEVAIGRHFGWPVCWRVGPDGGIDFTLANDETIDVKSVALRAESAHDFKLIVGPYGSRGWATASYYLLALVFVDESRAIIAGGISRERFQRLAAPDASMQREGVRPLTVRRSQLSQRWPACFLVPGSPAWRDAGSQTHIGPADGSRPGGRGALAV